ITLLDSRRSNNIAIILSQFRMEISEIKQALIDINEDVLTSEKIEALKKCLPTKEEVYACQFLLVDQSSVISSNLFLKDGTGQILQRRYLLISSSRVIRIDGMQTNDLKRFQ